MTRIDAAQTFLDEHPIPYPSFADPDKELANGTGANLIGAFPNTLFFDADGELVYAHQGVYPTRRRSRPTSRSTRSSESSAPGCG